MWYTVDLATVVPSIRIVKSSPFKGGLRDFSNRYSFTGGVPADSAHWTTLADAIIAVEKTLYAGDKTIIEAIGYHAGSDVPVFSATYSTAGTLTPSGSSIDTPLQNAALIRWSTAARSTKNHPIYAFSYMHGVQYTDATSGWDKVAATQHSNYQTFAGDWIAGFSDGTNTYIRSTPSGHAAVGSVVEEWTTHRDFPYLSSV